jgi:hypothetical protein
LLYSFETIERIIGTLAVDRDVAMTAPAIISSAGTIRIGLAWLRPTVISNNVDISGAR